MKVVTICGSMKFKDKMMEVAKDLEIKNKYVVIQCVYSNDKFNEEEQVLLADLHLLQHNVMSHNLSYVI